MYRYRKKILTPILPLLFACTLFVGISHATGPKVSKPTNVQPETRVETSTSANTTPDIRSGVSNNTSYQSTTTQEITKNKTLDSSSVTIASPAPNAAAKQTSDLKKVAASPDAQGPRAKSDVGAAIHKSEQKEGKLKATRDKADAEKAHEKKVKTTEDKIAESKKNNKKLDERKAQNEKVFQNKKLMSGRTIVFNKTQIKRKFKHAGDFGVKGNYNTANANKYESALKKHIQDSDTSIVQGTFRGQSVTHFVNQKTSLNVIRGSNNGFISGWRLNDDQLNNVLKSGNLGGG